MVRNTDVRRLLLIVPAVAAIAVAVGFFSVAALGAPAAAGTLFGTVGPDFSITLTDSTGARVTRLDPGTYDLQIDDRSPDHDFHLTGPGGVDVSTDVDFVGTITVTVTLVDGLYTYVCDPHSALMRGSFAVGTATAPPPPPPPPPAPATKLVGTVGPRATISLTRGGVKVKALKPGRYTITVRDRSAIQDFHLKGPGVNKATGLAYVGTKTWQLRFGPGRYAYFSDPHSAVVRGSFRVIS